MKDEEMAKEYAEEYYDEYRMTRGDIENAFLAGLKAGRPQWHRVADGDLPKEDCEVFAYYEKGSLCGKAKLEKYKKGVLWVDSGEVSLWVNDLGYQIRDVIAWCEIPTFDKE